MSTPDRRSTAPDTGADETVDALAEAEAAAAEAEARAEAARARADRVRRQARTGMPEQDETACEAVSTDTSEVPADDAADAAEAVAATRRLPGLATAVTVAALTLILCCSLTAIGLMAWQHWKSTRAAQHTSEVAAAARENTQVMMTLDHATAQADAQRVLDHSTGRFRDLYQAGEKDLVKDLEQSKVVTKVTVSDVAVESMADDSAVVLVAARTEGTNAEGAPQPPQLWRIAMTLAREDGRLKIAEVEFVK